MWRLSRTPGFDAALLAPLLAMLAAFFLLPVAVLLRVSVTGEAGPGAYLIMLTHPRYLQSLLATVILSLMVTAVTLAVSGVSGLFLQRNHFPGRSVLVAMLTFPLAFPGVVVGFMVIMLGGRQGLVGEISRALTGDRWVFAYSMLGLFVGYVYF